MRSARALSLIFFLASLTACGPSRSPSTSTSTPPPPPLPPDAGPPEVRIASWNVRLFFDDVCDSGRCEPGDWEETPSPADFAERAQEIAQAISRLDVDVIALEEVETQRSLDAIHARLPGFPHAVLGEIGSVASVDVAVLSRYPIVEVRGHRTMVLTRPDGSWTSFSRELLEVHLEAEGHRVVVFAAHLRSKSNDDPGRRLAEATAAREIVLATATSSAPALVVLGGDLNDVPGSEPLNALEADGGLVRASADQPLDEIGTYVYFGDSQAIDHLLVAPSAGGDTVPDSFEVVRSGSRGYGGSDHAAIRARFTVA
ncbi:MAG: endonuclease/exonuclease/phosphatase family protein, partial [Myxococcaceae bacterium]